jgi:hypothetical protein
VPSDEESEGLDPMNLEEKLIGMILRTWRNQCLGCLVIMRRRETEFRRFFWKER